MFHKIENQQAYHVLGGVNLAFDSPGLLVKNVVFASAAELVDQNRGCKSTFSKPLEWFLILKFELPGVSPSFEILHE